MAFVILPNHFNLSILKNLSEVVQKTNDIFGADPREMYFYIYNIPHPQSFVEYLVYQHVFL